MNDQAFCTIEVRRAPNPISFIVNTWHRFNNVDNLIAFQKHTNTFCFIHCLDDVIDVHRLRCMFIRKLNDKRLYFEVIKTTQGYEADGMMYD
mgnify:CR=1 FL=1